MEFDYTGRSKKGQLSVETEESSYIVFFENFLLAIKLKKSFVKATNKEQKKKYKEEGIGFFKRMEKIDDYWEEFGQRFLYMSEEEITKESKKVIKINYEEIKSYYLTPYRPERRNKMGDISIRGKKAKIYALHRHWEERLEYKKMSEILKNKADAN